MTDSHAERFVLGCTSQSRHFPNRTLFLVDRNKNQSTWWKPDLTDALVFTSRESAETVRNKLKFNMPRVIPYGYAKTLCDNQLSRDLKLKEQTQYQYSLPLSVPPQPPSSRNKKWSSKSPKRYSGP